MLQLKTHNISLSGKPGFNWTSSLGRALIALLSPGGSNHLSILIYHRVLPRRDPLFPSEVDAQAFDEQLALLNACFNIIPLSDAICALRQRKLPPRAACITFDDGYADNAEFALPILQKHDISSTFFVATGFLNGGRMWNDTVIEIVRGAPGEILDLCAIGMGAFEIATIEQRRQAIFALLSKLKYLPLRARQEQIDRMCSHVRPLLPNDLMMTSDQVRKLHSAGMEIGGHTVNHPILARMNRVDARDEIGGGKEMLESIVRAPVRLFAYPNGKPHQDYLSDHVDIVKDLGFDGAVSTAWGAAQTGHDLYQLPRFTPWDRSMLKFTVRLAQNMLRKPQIV